MKKTIFILTLLSFTILFSCSQSESNEGDKSEVTTTIEQEKELAKEAKEESKAAKDEAAETEASIDKLLEDI